MTYDYIIGNNKIKVYAKRSNDKKIIEYNDND